MVVGDTPAAVAYAKAYLAWQRAANAAPKSRRVQYQEEKKRNERIERLYLAVDRCREALRNERLGSAPR